MDPVYTPVSIYFIVIYNAIHKCYVFTVECESKGCLAYLSTVTNIYEKHEIFHCKLFTNWVGNTHASLT